VIPTSWPLLDERNANQFVEELLSRRGGFVPEWLISELNPDKGRDIAIAQIAARYLQAIVQRLNQAPDKNKLAFLDLLSIDLIAAQAARAPIVFRLSDKAPDMRLPAGTRLAAPPPPEQNAQIIFETERAVGVASAKVKEVVSLWPGRDQYIDHSAAIPAGQLFHPFKKAELTDTPHAIYISHEKLLALAGKSNVDVRFELTTPSSEPLSVIWEYWDGELWQTFLNNRSSCFEESEAFDGTGGFLFSGAFYLKADCAETKKVRVNAVEGFWIRGRLTEPLPPNPDQVLPEVDDIKLQTTVTRPEICSTSKQAQLTFESLPAAASFGGAGGQSGKVILTENNIAVSLLETDPAENLGTVTINNDASKFGGDKYAKLSNVYLQFDFSGLGGAVDLVGFDFFEFHDGITIGVNGSSPIDVRSLGKTKLAPGVVMNLSGESSLSGKRVALIEGQVDTLVVGSGGSIHTVFVHLTRSDGFLPDAAFAGANKLDVSKAFYPLGENPRPGDAFYFSSEELLSKPKASASIFIRTTPTPEQTFDVQPGDNQQSTRETLSHSVVWEYWNGRAWTPLLLAPKRLPSHQPDFDDSDEFAFEVPEDISPTKVNDQEARWIRGRLSNGGYGFKTTVAWSDTASGTPNQFATVVTQPPALAEFKLCYSWTYGPFHPEYVFTHNDFRYEDHTEDARWPGLIFKPFQTLADVTPALYLGFDRKLPVDRLNLFFDVVEESGETLGPELLWQYWDGFSWEDLTVEDETRNLRLPGMVSLIGPDDSEPLSRFETERHWLRARLKEDGPPGEPTLAGIFPNAVWATQRQTVVEDVLGTSNGQPNQNFRLRQFPVLGGEQGVPSERIEVRELFGPRANTEWRFIVAEIFGSDAKVVAELEEQLGKEGGEIDIQRGDLRLRRDRNKRVSEVWVRWLSRPHFFFSGPNDRDYVLQRARGRLFFGDGDRGKIPPLGAAILAREYRSGGGIVGNVAANKITQLLGGLAGIEAVFNPTAAEGGADTETLEALSRRGPQTVRHRGRALLPLDYETFARETSPAVGFARAIPTRDPRSRRMPGWVTLLIIPQSDEPRPWPSFGLREQVRKRIEAHTAADLAAAHRIFVTGPDYIAIDVEASVVPCDPTEAGAIEARALDALQRFLHPLRGGPEGRGWEMGRDVFLSDVASVLERVEGVDFVKELCLQLDGHPQGERVSIPDDRIVVAGRLKLKLLEL
jgi:Baseplate J-like protein